MFRQAGLLHSYDLILAAETIYSESSFGAFTALLQQVGPDSEVQHYMYVYMNVAAFPADAWSLLVPGRSAAGLVCHIRLLRCLADEHTEQCSSFELRARTLNPKALKKKQKGLGTLNPLLEPCCGVAVHLGVERCIRWLAD